MYGCLTITWLQLIQRTLPIKLFPGTDTYHKATHSMFILTHCGLLMSYGNIDLKSFARGLRVADLQINYISLTEMIG